MPTASTDKPTEVVTDAVYQVRLPDGRTKKRYVKTTRTYGHGSEDVDGEIALDREHPENVGKPITIAVDLLCEPDTFPKFMFQPETWLTKANLSTDELKHEVTAFLDSWFAADGTALAADFNLATDVGRVLEAVKIALTGYFGGFSLVLIMHWLKNKLENRLNAANPPRVTMPFERKLGSMKQILQERQENLNTPLDQRGEFNSHHPFGTPRPDVQFGQASAEDPLIDAMKAQGIDPTKAIVNDGFVAYGDSVYAYHEGRLKKLSPAEALVWKKKQTAKKTPKVTSAVTATVEPGYDIKDHMREYGLDPAKATVRNGIIVEYRGNVNLNGKDLAKLPFRFVKVTGSFSCSYNHLTSLAGCPREVGGDFWCDSNLLTSLAGCPEKVGASFSCAGNRLTSLAGCPREVGGGFYCNNNHLTSLAGCPREVGASFSCTVNRLTSLVGCPREVGKDFWCSDNPGSAGFEKPAGVKGAFFNA